MVESIYHALFGSSYKFLFDLGIILISTKLLGMLSRRIHLPQVVGALLAGLILGPACLNIIGELGPNGEIIASSTFISRLAEIGVIVLMFSAGLETDIKELRKSGFKSFIIALFGVIVPLLMGWALTSAFNKDMLQNIFIGVILTATSVSITVETLKELGKLSTHSGNAILGAALIDDVLGIIALTVISSFADSSVSLGAIGIKIIGFFVFCAIIALLFIKFVIPWLNSYKKDLRRFVIIAFFFCLIMAYISESVFGVSDITGAFVAGLILSSNRHTTFLIGRFEIVSFMFLSPIFFADVGLKVTLGSMNASMVIFAILLLLVAVVSKILGCGLGAKACGYTNLQATKIGIGMVSRGEVALIVASKGAALGLMREDFFAPIIIVVVATTILTPIMLKLVYKYQSNHQEDVLIDSALIERHQEKVAIERLTQNAINMHEDMKEQLKRERAQKAEQNKQENKQSSKK